MGPGPDRLDTAYLQRLNLGQLATVRGTLRSSVGCTQSQSDDSNLRGLEIAYGGEFMGLMPIAEIVILARHPEAVLLPLLECLRARVAQLECSPTYLCISVRISNYNV